MSQAPVDPSESAKSLWKRYGWLYSGIWLVFLTFPLVAVAGAEAPALERAFAAGCLTAFAVVYLRGFLLQDRLGSRRAVAVMSWRYLAVLTVLGLATVPTIGVDALGVAPFLCSFAIFGLPLRPGFGVPLVLALAIGGVAALTSWWVALYLLPVALVTVSTGVVRVFELTEVAAEELRVQHRLAAERDRVARDVHDVLGHSLTVVSVKAELAARLVERDPARAQAELADIQALTRTALSEIRSTVGGLRATRLADEVHAAQAALSAAGIGLDAPDDPDSVEPRSRIGLAWVLREAVTNVVRHSNASRVVVRWGSNWLEVLDDGRGRRGRSEGNGLTGLRERVTALGGLVEIDDGPSGVGTRVRVEQL